MNIGIPLATILSLVLALAAGGATKDVTKDQTSAPSPPELYGHNLNHSETLVRDAAPTE